MSKGYRKGLHTIYDIQYHIVWVTKYRYHVLKGDVSTFFIPSQGSMAGSQNPAASKFSRGPLSTGFLRKKRTE